MHACVRACACACACACARAIIDLCCTVLQIALSVGSSWFRIGSYLKMTDQYLKECQLRHPHEYHRRLLDVLVDWKKQEDHPVIGELVDACTEAGVGGEVKRVLNYKDV